jgi:hypothetical protein
MSALLIAKTHPQKGTPTPMQTDDEPQKLNISWTKLDEVKGGEFKAKELLPARRCFLCGARQESEFVVLVKLGDNPGGGYIFSVCEPCWELRDDNEVKQKYFEQIERGARPST